MEDSVKGLSYCVILTVFKRLLQRGIHVRLCVWEYITYWLFFRDQQKWLVAKGKCLIEEKLGAYEALETLKAFGGGGNMMDIES